MDLPLERFNPNVQVYAVANPSLGDYELIGPGFLSILTDEVDAQTVYYLEVHELTYRQKTNRERH